MLVILHYHLVDVWGKTGLALFIFSLNGGALHMSDVVCHAYENILIKECNQFYAALRPYRSPHLGQSSIQLYQEAYASIPYADKEWWVTAQILFQNSDTTMQYAKPTNVKLISCLCQTEILMYSPTVSLSCLTGKSACGTGDAWPCPTTWGWWSPSPVTRLSSDMTHRGPPGSQRTSVKGKLCAWCTGCTVYYVIKSKHQCAANHKPSMSSSSAGVQRCVKTHIFGSFAVWHIQVGNNTKPRGKDISSGLIKVMLIHVNLERIP